MRFCGPFFLVNLGVALPALRHQIDLLGARARDVPCAGSRTLRHGGALVGDFAVTSAHLTADRTRSPARVRHGAT